MEITRVFVPAIEPGADANIRRRYAIEAAAWVWHNEPAGPGPEVLRWRRRFELETPTTLTVHVSADERFELWVDGTFASAGPHRGDATRWAFASYRVSLSKGEHVFDALTWWLGELAPAAQVTQSPGFILAVEERDELNTGEPRWTVRRVRGRQFSAYRPLLPSYFVSGPEETIAPARDRDAEPEGEPRVVSPPIQDNATGVVAPGKRLDPSPLPDMLRAKRGLGRVRSVMVGAGVGDAVVSVASTRGETWGDWPALMRGEGHVVVPPRTTVAVIVDPETYLCGYPTAELSGGGDGWVRVEWAESLYEVDKDGGAMPAKGDRSAVAGKRFTGFGDRLEGPGESLGVASYRTLWWRAGRMLRVIVHTGEEAMTLLGLGAIETRYPLEHEASWSSDDPGLEAAIPLMVRSMQMCAHETYMDCPYYEQLMYVGDTRLEMLTAYVMTRDDRLTRRGIELFDHSRRDTGLVAERFPSTPSQQSTTYALIWVAMVRDYLWWRGDAAWVRQRLAGIRGMLEQVLMFREHDGLFRRFPGWSFVDWVAAWPTGMPPAIASGEPSSILNLHVVLAMRSAEALERAVGDATLAERYRSLGDDLARGVAERFYQPDRGLLADDQTSRRFSEHAQVLALLHGVFDDEQQATVLENLATADDLARCSVYFSHYLLETFARFSRGDLVIDRLRGWRAMPDLGFHTTPEQPEPSRSDCHAWGAHPLFHMHASLAGVRPDAPGFASVRIAPCPGSLRRIDARTPHPKGTIHTALRFDDHGGGTADITLPPDVPGRFRWADTAVELSPGGPTSLQFTTDRINVTP